MEGFAEMQLPLLEYLDLSRNGIGESLNFMRAFSSLKGLCLSDCQLREKDLLVLTHAHFPRLHLLELSNYSLTSDNNKVSDSGIEHLSRMQTLRELYLKETGMSARGVEKLMELELVHL